MSIGGYKVFGATGPAPTTVWFGHLPDRLNCLQDMDFGSNLGLFPNRFIKESFANVTLFSQWRIYNTIFDSGPNAATVAFGANSTAPDGTNDAKMLAETATNSIHIVTAGFLSSSAGTGTMGFTRLAGFFKNAGRRIILEVSDLQRIGGARVCFDLAGGQIGVAPAVFGSMQGANEHFDNLSAEIVPSTGGFYKCSFDFNSEMGSVSNIYRFAIYLDNASGTAAISDTYVGNGTSGVIGWKTNLMPVRSYQLTSPVFFDDFTDATMSRFDLTNSLAAGFDWYLQNKFPNPNYTTIPATAANQLSVSGSVLTIDDAAPPICLESFAATFSGENYVGNTWGLPCYIEGRISYSNQQNLINWAFWMFSREEIVQAVPTRFGCEIDIAETQVAGSVSPTTFHHILRSELPTPVEQYLLSGQPDVGIPTWTPWRGYGPGNIVCYPTGSNTFYIAGPGSPVAGVPPPAANWAVYTGPPVGESALAGPPTFNNVGMLMIPYQKGDFGYRIVFWNGGVSYYLPYKPDALVKNSTFLDGANRGDPVIHVMDNRHYPIFASMKYADYYRVTQ